MKSRLVLSIMLIFSLTACEKFIYVHIEESDRLLVLSGLINPDSLVHIHVSRSQQLSLRPEDSGRPPKRDTMIIADLLLYEQEQLIGKMEHIGKSYYSLPEFFPSEGNTYRIEATSGEMKPVSVETILLPAIPFNSFDTIRLFHDDGREGFSVKMQITDPVGQENYYAMKVTAVQRKWDRNLEDFTDEQRINYLHVSLNRGNEAAIDNIFLDINSDVYLDRKLFFRDQFFDGKDFDMSFEFNKSYFYKPADTTHFQVELEHIDKSYYLYAISQQKYRNTEDNPFTEPVNLYSNVKEGLGLVSSYSSTRKNFTVIWTK